MELFERPKNGETAILVQINLQSSTSEQCPNEFRELVRSAGARDVVLIGGSRGSPDPKYFIGSGKTEEISQSVKIHDADVVIFDHTLSPAQERNLEKRLECRVLDRTGLILDIFAQRARSHEGKLQVELAQLKHMSTRLVRGWTHLERQKGGIGLRGPGETQLETDRRLLNIRIKQINKRLAKVRNQREQGRQSRKKNQTPTVSLVGYTNAGKSTLFNRLTDAEVYAADQLFATLDPTLRRVKMGSHTHIILADTVGFIKDLPHDLVAAFRSTLQETIEADLLLHVIDCNDENRDMYRREVNEVIRQIGAEHVPQIEIMNKVDLHFNKTPRIEEAREDQPTRIWLSAKENTGIEALKDFLAEAFTDSLFTGAIVLPVNHAALRARLYNDSAVEAESITEDGNYQLQLNIPRKQLDKYLQEARLQTENKSSDHLILKPGNQN